MRLFTIVGNVRTGSTHLMTSLNRLKDISCDYELKWKPSYNKHDVHIFLNPGDEVAQVLSSHLPDNEVIGSKFLLDPYLGSIIVKKAVPDVLNLFSPEISILHVTRSYFDIFISMFARGGVHVCNDERFRSESILGRHTASADEKIPQRPIEFNRQQCLIILLNMFHNDLLCLELCRQAEKYLVIDYSQINLEFSRISHFLGTREKENVIQEIIDNPFLKKLGAIDLNLVPEVRFCRTVSKLLSDCLQDEINLLIKKEPSKKPVIFFESNGQVQVNLIPELVRKFSENQIPVT